jgi:hypothetical protein
MQRDRRRPGDEEETADIAKAAEKRQRRLNRITLAGETKKKPR